jgi:hypothetical protein
MNQPGTSTGAIAVTAGAQTITGPGVLLSVECVGGSAAGTVTVYDGTSTSGLRLCSLAGVAIGVTQVASFPQGIVFNTGLFVVVAGTASTGCLTYRRN